MYLKINPSTVPNPTSFEHILAVATHSLSWVLLAPSQVMV